MPLDRPLFPIARGISEAHLPILFYLGPSFPRADLSYQQCLVNPAVNADFPTLATALVFTPRASLVQHTGIKTTLWSQNSPMFHRALNFADERSLTTNACMRRLREQAVGLTVPSCKADATTDEAAEAPGAGPVAKKAGKVPPARFKARQSALKRPRL